MSGLPSPFRLPLPALLASLLALLLWGQCAFNVNEHGRYVPTVSVRVARDSLGAATAGQPAHLYLTLVFTNHLSQACRLDTARGNVSFNRQYWNFVAPAVHGLELPPQGHHRVPVMIPLVPPVDSLATFRAALRTGSHPDNALRVYLRVLYTTPSEPGYRLPAKASTYLPAQQQR